MEVSAAKGEHWNVVAALSLRSLGAPTVRDEYWTLLWSLLKSSKKTHVPETEWKIAKKICGFLEISVRWIEKCSGSSNVTSSSPNWIYDRMVKFCGLPLVQNDCYIKLIAEKMEAKLQGYNFLVMSSLAFLARALGSLVLTDLLRDANHSAVVRTWTKIQVILKSWMLDQIKIPKICFYFLAAYN